MNIQLFDIELKAPASEEQLPFLTNLNVLEGGGIYVSSAFDEGLLYFLKPNKKGTEIKEIESFELRKHFGDDAVIACGSLMANSSGDTAFEVVHRGSAPSFLKSMMGGQWPHLDAFVLSAFLANNDGGMGFGCRHSVGQLQDGQIEVRRFKESGALTDVVHMGDFLLGLSGSTLWREGYLEMRIEKRVYVRKDFKANGQIHRDAADNFWFYGANNRLHRMKISDIKAKPTFRTLEGPMWTHSEPSFTDGWLYGVDKEDRQLFRVRENPVSYEDEIQKIHNFKMPVDSLCAMEIGSNPFMIIATSSEHGCELYKLPLIKPEDPEFVPDVPKIEKLGNIEGVTRVKDLTLRKISESQYQVFALAFGDQAGQSGKVVGITF